MPTVLEDLTAKRDAEIERLEQLMSRDDFNPEDPELVTGKDQIATLNRTIKERTDWEQLKAASNKLTAAQVKVNRDNDGLIRRTSEPELSPGELFTRSEVYQNYPGQGTSSRMELKTRATSLPSVLADFSGVLPPRPQRDVTPSVRFTLLDLLGSTPVSGNSVETIVWSNTGGTTALVVGEGSPKPDVEYGVSVQPYTLSTIAAWTQLTRQLMEDAPAVTARINQMLAREIRIKCESEAATALVAATLPTATGTTLMEAIRLGMATVEGEGYDPTAVLLNPADYASLDIEVFTKTLAGTQVNRAFWGLTPISHKAQAAGTATVGDFQAGVERYARTGVNVYITDSHSATFTSNVFTILAEAREKTIVVQPKALVECSKLP